MTFPFPRGAVPQDDNAHPLHALLRREDTISSLRQSLQGINDVAGFERFAVGNHAGDAVGNTISNHNIGNRSMKPFNSDDRTESIADRRATMGSTLNRMGSITSNFSSSTNVGAQNAFGVLKGRGSTLNQMGSFSPTWNSRQLKSFATQVTIPDLRNSQAETEKTRESENDYSLAIPSHYGRRSADLTPAPFDSAHDDLMSGYETQSGLSVSTGKKGVGKKPDPMRSGSLCSIGSQRSRSGGLVKGPGSRSVSSLSLSPQRSAAQIEQRSDGHSMSGISEGSIRSQLSQPRFSTPVDTRDSAYLGKDAQGNSKDGTKDAAADTQKNPSKDTNSKNTNSKDTNSVSSEETAENAPANKRYSRQATARAAHLKRTRTGHQLREWKKSSSPDGGIRGQIPRLKTARGQTILARTGSAHAVGKTFVNGNDDNIVIHGNDDSISPGDAAARAKSTVETVAKKPAEALGNLDRAMPIEPDVVSAEFVRVGRFNRKPSIATMESAMTMSRKKSEGSESPVFAPTKAGKKAGKIPPSDATPGQSPPSGATTSSRAKSLTGTLNRVNSPTGMSAPPPMSPMSPLTRGTSRGHPMGYMMGAPAVREDSVILSETSSAGEGSDRDNKQVKTTAPKNRTVHSQSEVANNPEAKLAMKKRTLTPTSLDSFPTAVDKVSGKKTAVTKDSKSPKKANPKPNLKPRAASKPNQQIETVGNAKPNQHVQTVAENASPVVAARPKPTTDRKVSDFGGSAMRTGVPKNAPPSIAKNTPNKAVNAPNTAVDTANKAENKSKALNAPAWSAANLKQVTAKKPVTGVYDFNSINTEKTGTIESNASGGIDSKEAEAGEADEPRSLNHDKFHRPKELPRGMTRDICDEIIENLHNVEHMLEDSENVDLTFTSQISDRTTVKTEFDRKSRKTGGQAGVDPETVGGVAPKTAGQGQCEKTAAMSPADKTRKTIPADRKSKNRTPSPKSRTKAFTKTVPTVGKTAAQKSPAQVPSNVGETPGTVAKGPGRIGQTAVVFRTSEASGSSARKPDANPPLVPTTSHASTQGSDRQLASETSNLGGQDTAVSGRGRDVSRYSEFNPTEEDEEVQVGSHVGEVDSHILTEYDNEIMIVDNFVQSEAEHMEVVFNAKNIMAEDPKRKDMLTDLKHKAVLRELCRELSQRDVADRTVMAHLMDPQAAAQEADGWLLPCTIRESQQCSNILGSATEYDGDINSSGQNSKSNITTRKPESVENDDLERATTRFARGTRFDYHSHIKYRDSEISSVPVSQMSQSTSQTTQSDEKTQGLEKTRASQRESQSRSRESQKGRVAEGGSSEKDRLGSEARSSQRRQKDSLRSIVSNPGIAWKMEYHHASNRVKEIMFLLNQENVLRKTNEAQIALLELELAKAKEAQNTLLELELARAKNLAIIGNQSLSPCIGATFEGAHFGRSPSGVDHFGKGNASLGLVGMAGTMQGLAGTATSLDAFALPGGNQLGFIGAENFHAVEHRELATDDSYLRRDVETADWFGGASRTLAGGPLQTSAVGSQTSVASPLATLMNTLPTVDAAKVPSLDKLQAYIAEMLPVGDAVSENQDKKTMLIWLIGRSLYILHGRRACHPSSNMNIDINTLIPKELQTLAKQDRGMVRSASPVTKGTSGFSMNVSMGLGCIEKVPATSAGGNLAASNGPTVGCEYSARGYSSDTPKKTALGTSTGAFGTASPKKTAAFGVPGNMDIDSPQSLQTSQMGQLLTQQRDQSLKDSQATGSRGRDQSQGDRRNSKGFKDRSGIQGRVKLEKGSTNPFDPKQQRNRFWEWQWKNIASKETKTMFYKFAELQYADFLRDQKNGLTNLENLIKLKAPYIQSHSVELHYKRHEEMLIEEDAEARKENERKIERIAKMLRRTYKLRDSSTSDLRRLFSVHLGFGIGESVAGEAGGKLTEPGKVVHLDREQTIKEAQKLEKLKSSQEERAKSRETRRIEALRRNLKTSTFYLKKGSGSEKRTRSAQNTLQKDKRETDFARSMSPEGKKTNTGKKGSTKSVGTLRKPSVPSVSQKPSIPTDIREINTTDTTELFVNEGKPIKQHSDIEFVHEYDIVSGKQSHSPRSPPEGYYVSAGPSSGFNTIRTGNLYLDSLLNNKPNHTDYLLTNKPLKSSVGENRMLSQVRSGPVYNKSVTKPQKKKYEKKFTTENNFSNNTNDSSITGIGKNIKPKSPIKPAVDTGAKASPRSRKDLQMIVHTSLQALLHHPQMLVKSKAEYYRHKHKDLLRQLELETIENTLSQAKQRSSQILEKKLRLSANTVTVPRKTAASTYDAGNIVSRVTKGAREEEEAVNDAQRGILDEMDELEEEFPDPVLHEDGSITVNGKEIIANIICTAMPINTITGNNILQNLKQEVQYNSLFQSPFQSLELRDGRIGRFLNLKRNINN